MSQHDTDITGDELIRNERIKRRVYMTCMFIISAVLVCAWLFKAPGDTYRAISVPLFVLVVMGLAIVIWRESMPLAQVESLILMAVAAMPLSRQIWLYSVAGMDEQWLRLLGNNYWATSAVIVFGFAIGDRRHGLITGVSIVLMSVAIAVVGAGTGLARGYLHASVITYVAGALIFLTLFLVLMSIATITKDQWHTAISRAAVYSRWALTDKLTGLANRHAGVDILTRQCAAAGRQDRALSVIMGDLDDFKQVNDTHGHVVGDTVLEGVAEILRSTVRETDAVIRWGGEEFLIVAVDSDLNSARVLAERCRYAIEKEPIAGIRMTMTFGVAQYMPGDTQDSLLARADENLYTGKGTSGNRVEV